MSALHRIRLASPAKEWENGFPLGNGKLGAMIRGGVRDDIITLNEETLYYGGPKRRINPDAGRYWETVRELLREGETESAAALAKASMTGTPKYLSPFVPAGDLRVSFSSHDGRAEQYTRVLDLDHGMAAVSYQMCGHSFRREYFTCLAHNVLAVRISGDAPINFMANLNRRPYEQYSAAINDNTTGIWGRCGEDGVRYFGGVTARATGGNFSVIGDFIRVTDALSAEIFVAFDTDFGGQEGYREECLERLEQAACLGWNELYRRHAETYHALFDRVELSIGSDAEPPATTDVLLDQIRNSHMEHAPYLAALGFHFGRYLLISSSYRCKTPANLQGLWNDSYNPPWESVYTININIQMNYWPAEVCALPECHEPLFGMIENLCEKGKAAAREMYGCRGFVAHHNTDIWGDAAPVGIIGSSPIWPMGGAWLALHLYEHYAFTGDLRFLEDRAMPVISEALVFFEDYLTPDSHGLLQTGPSLSPENAYISFKGQIGSLCMAPTMDSQILRELCQCYLNGCAALNSHPEQEPRIQHMLGHLPPTQISPNGRIQEWKEDYQEVEPGHRHISHLFGLHPGSQITDDTPELMRAAEKTLAYRLANGGGHTGWSRAWIINFFARLGKGDSAWEHIIKLISLSMTSSLLDMHPPFQIDGNFGLTAGIAEMLAQSHTGTLVFLPALPAAWPNGLARGLCLRGGIASDFRWENGELTRLILTSAHSQTVTVRYGRKETILSLDKGKPVDVDLST